MGKRLILLGFLLFCAIRAEALEYTDVYYAPDEPGWGVFLVQSDKTQFLAFFIYGADGKPVWYTAQLTDNGAGSYTGALYAITGTYFALPWQGYDIASAGTASFRPTDPYHATLTYTVSNIAMPTTVTKSIQRQTLTPYVLGGDYSGSMSGSITGCSDLEENDAAFRARYGLAVTQVADTSVQMIFTFVDTSHAGLSCMLSGSLAHLGRLYQSSAQLTCTGPGQSGVAQPVTVDGLHPTGQGIEGRMSGSLGSGCTASLHFSAVRNVNN